MLVQARAWQPQLLVDWVLLLWRRQRGLEQQQQRGQRRAQWQQQLLQQRPQRVVRRCAQRGRSLRSWGVRRCLKRRCAWWWAWRRLRPAWRMMLPLWRPMLSWGVHGRASSMLNPQMVRGVWVSIEARQGWPARSNHGFDALSRTASMQP